jgi:hypothetical protein
VLTGPRDRWCAARASGLSTTTGPSNRHRVASALND